jgi:hypothetical protein
VPVKAGSGKNALGGLFLCGLFAFAIYAAFDDKKADATASAKAPADQLTSELHEVRGFSSVDLSALQSTGVLTVAVKSGSIFEGGNMTKDVLEAVKKAGSALPYKTVTVRVNERLVDGYGRESDEPLFDLTYGRDDIEKMNFPNLVGWGVLDLAEVAGVSPIAGRIARQECEPGSDNAKFARAFCAVATAN